MLFNVIIARDFYNDDEILNCADGSEVWNRLGNRQRRLGYFGIVALTI